MIEVRYKSRIGKFSRKQENMEEAENKIKYLKHLNDMSPEEYAWCTGADE